MFDMNRPNEPHSLERILSFLNQYQFHSITKKNIAALSAMLDMEEKQVRKALENAGIRRLGLERSDENYPLPDEESLRNVEEALSSIRSWAATLLESIERIGLCQAQNIYDYVAFYSTGVFKLSSTEITQQMPEGLQKKLSEEAMKWREGKSEEYSPERILDVLRDLSLIHMQNIKPFIWYKMIEAESFHHLLAIDQNSPACDPRRYACKTRYDNYLLLKESNIIDDLKFCQKHLPLGLQQTPSLYRSVIHRMMQVNNRLSERQCIEIYNRFVFGGVISNYVEL